MEAAGRAGARAGAEQVAVLKVGDHLPGLGPHLLQLVVGRAGILEEAQQNGSGTIREKLSPCKKDKRSVTRQATRK